MPVRSVIKQLRIKHYVKNVLVFLPLVFSVSLLDFALAFRALLAFLAFCGLSSAVYTLNDIIDAPMDRLHPGKKDRPIASGAITPAQGVLLAALCAAAALTAALFISLTAALILGAYAVINVLYSLVLKKHAIVDVFCVMAGFLLRVAAGAAAVGVPVSNWLLLSIMSLSLFMGFGKRLGELRRWEGGGGDATRSVLSLYSRGFLERATYAMMTLSIAFYALWAIDPATTAHFGAGADKLVWTTPLVIAGMLRYALCVETSPEDGDPTGVILTDVPIRVICGVYLAAVMFIIYCP